MSRVAALCAIIGTTVALRWLIDRSFPQPAKIGRAFQKLGLPPSSVATTPSGPGMVVGHRTSGSDCGDPPREIEQQASICVVSSIETSSTQSTRRSSQMIEAFGGAFADVDGQLVEMGSA